MQMSEGPFSHVASHIQQHHVHYSLLLDNIFPFTKPVYVLRPVGKKVFENTVGKGENVIKKHFLLLSQCFNSGAQ